LVEGLEKYLTFDKNRGVLASKGLIFTGKKKGKNHYTIGKWLLLMNKIIIPV
jgi:hypothetical protein